MRLRVRKIIFNLKGDWELRRGELGKTLFRVQFCSPTLTRGKNYLPPQVLPRVLNLPQSQKLTQGLGHVATPEMGGNAYI